MVPQQVSCMNYKLSTFSWQARTSLGFECGVKKKNTCNPSFILPTPGHQRCLPFDGTWQQMEGTIRSDGIVKSHLKHPRYIQLIPCCTLHLDMPSVCGQNKEQFIATHAGSVSPELQFPASRMGCLLAGYLEFFCSSSQSAKTAASYWADPPDVMWLFSQATISNSDSNLELSFNFVLISRSLCVVF